MDESDDRSRLILLDALASYGDACTLPLLTPSCPFYNNDDGVATCEEECRALLASWGGGTRPVQTIKQGGLVMTGRAIPRSSAAGTVQFDAAERYLADRSLAVAQQSTGSLLLGLEAAMKSMPRPERFRSIGRALDHWDELDRRGLPVEAIVRAGVLPSLAAHIAVLTSVSFTNVRAHAETSTEMLERLDVFLRPWRDLLEASVELEGSEEDLQRVIRLTSRPAELHRRLFGTRPNMVGFADDGQEAVEISDPRSRLMISYAMSGRFIDRVLEWFSLSLSDEKLSVLNWQAPPVGVFTALGGRHLSDEHGLWLWERHTVTHLDDWETSSLLAEWRAHDVSDHEVSPLVYGERSCDHEAVAAIALRRLTGKRHARPRQVRGLKAADLTSRAVELLRVGNNEAAAEVFAGLVDLRPWDGDALNNLGFCLMPKDPVAALQRLQEASLYPGESVTINVANRVFCLTRLGRTHEAADLAREWQKAAPDHPSRERPCHVWSVDESTDELVLSRRATQWGYLEELLDDLS